MNKKDISCCGNNQTKDSCKLKGSISTMESLQPSLGKAVVARFDIIVSAFALFSFGEFNIISKIRPGDHYFPPPKTGRLLSILLRSLQI